MTFPTEHDSAKAMPSPKTPTSPVQAWAQGLVDELTGKVSASDLMRLRQQEIAITTVPVVTTSPAANPTKPTIISTAAALTTLAELLVGADVGSVDLETSTLIPSTGVIVGIGIAMESGAYYIPVAHRFAESGELRPHQLPLSQVLNALRLQDRRLIAHNPKFEMKWLRRHGGIECSFTWDTMLAARLLRSDLEADLEVVAVRELDVPEWALPKADMSRIQQLPVERVAAYCAKDVVYTLQLFRRQHACLV